MGKTCIFTGHRVILSAHLATMPMQLDAAIEGVRRAGFTAFWVGGAMGFDRMAADAVLRAKEKHPEITLGILVPCRDQDARWRDEERRAYRKQLEAADFVEVLSDRYYDGCMKVRNQALVDRAELCLSYVRNGRSGSAQTASMAEKRGIMVINIANRFRES